VTGHYTLMSCNGLEWIQPPSNQSRIPGSYGYYDPPSVIVNELNRLVDRIKRLEEALESIREYWNRDNNERAMEDACWHAINTASEALEAKEAKP
jgi:hypothetical protein